MNTKFAFEEPCAASDLGDFGSFGTGEPQSLQGIESLLELKYQCCRGHALIIVFMMS